MRSILLATLLGAAAMASPATAAPATKEQMLVPPPGARHYTISSIAGKHGDVWSWTAPDGRPFIRTGDVGRFDAEGRHVGGGIVSPHGPAGSMILFHGCLVHASTSPMGRPACSAIPATARPMAASRTQPSRR